MRCLNCSTVLMDSDIVCPFCGVPTPYRPPPNYGNLTPPATTGPAPVIARRCGTSIGRAAVFFAIGLGLLGLAAHLYASRQGDAQRGAHVITAAELVKADLDKMADPWVAYVMPHCRYADVEIVRKYGGVPTSTMTRFLLVKVEDHWLVASVAPDFVGARLEGRLEKWETPFMREVLAKIRAQHPDEAHTLLPFQMNAEQSFAGHVATDNIVDGIIALVGMVFVVLGAKCLFLG